MTNRPFNAATCPACSGRGEVHFSPSHDDRPCGKCGGKGWLPPEVVNADRATNDQQRAAQPLRALAAQYRHAAGQAFGSGNDTDATAFRDAAVSLDNLAAKLPPLPPITRP